MEQKKYSPYNPEDHEHSVPDNFRIEEKNNLSPILPNKAIDSFKEPKKTTKISIVSSLEGLTENQLTNPIENPESTAEQAKHLNTPNIKLNLFFEPDEKSLATLQQFYQKIKAEFGDIIFERKEGSLPFHFTIIGSGKISEQTLLDFEAKKGILRDSLLKLKMYNSEKRIPKVQKFQPSWSAFPEGRERTGIIRIKFSIGDYILSGNWDINKKIAEILGNTDMDFSLPSHITLFTFLLPEDYHLSFDDLQRELKKIYDQFDRGEIILTPKATIKRPGEHSYSELDYSTIQQINTKKQ